MAIAALVLPARVRAQSTALDPGRSGSEIVVVPSLSGDRSAPWLDAAASQLAPLGSSPENTLERFEARHSSAPAEVSNDDVDRWIAQSRNAVRHLAQTDYARARDALLEAQSLSERAAEVLNREAELQRQVLDTCLFMVRAFLETRAVANAEAQARECRRLVPRGPISRRHTPEVRELLRRVDRHLMEEEPGFLRVDADRAGCVVRLNGIDFGRTPFEMHDLARGEYRIQVECDENVRGRVHRVQLEAVGTHLHVDTRFDSIVRTEPLIHLRYPDVAAESSSRLADAVTIGRAVQAREVWILTPVFDTSEAALPAFFRADRVFVGNEPEVVATVLLPPPNAEGRPFHEPIVQAAQAAFEAERAIDLRSGSAVVLSDSSPALGGEVAADDATPEPTRRARVRRGLGIGLTSLGAGLFGTSVGLYFRRATLGDRFEREPPQSFHLDVQKAWVSARAPMLASATAASASVASGFGLLLSGAEREDAVPWWAWSFGAAGAGAVAGGLVDFFLADVCPRDTVATPVCVAGAEQRDRAVLVMLGGASLASVPLSSWLEDRLGGAELDVKAGVGEARIGLRGTF